MCTNEGKDEVSPRAVGRHPGLDAPYKGEPLAHQGAPADIYSEAANSVQREARAGLQAAASTCGDGPKCLVAGCNNRFGEGVFHGELCAPCHANLVSGHVRSIGDTFLHSMQRALNTAREQAYYAKAVVILDGGTAANQSVGRATALQAIVNALKEGEKNDEEGKRQSR